jgi:hypothetical protein
MKIWEYENITVEEPELFQTLIDQGKLCWELVVVIPAQKIVPAKILGTPPTVITAFMLVFKRDREQGYIPKP